MTTTTPEQRKMADELSRYVDRQILRAKGIIKESMENLAEDFNENFMWDPEKIYKGNRRLEFLNEIRQLLDDDECNMPLTTSCTATHTATAPMPPPISPTNGSLKVTKRFITSRSTYLTA